MERLPELKEEDRLALQALLAERERRLKYRKIDYLFPDTGPRARHLYKKQLEFFKAGATHRLRLFCAGNQSGKTVSGGTETTFHATEDYPYWWEGAKLKGDLEICMIGVNSEETKNVLQKLMLGDRADPGTGLLPKDSIIGDPVSRAGVAEGVSLIRVRRKGGGVATIHFKYVQQGREAFQGTKYHFVMFDEEPPKDVFNEALMRTATTDGLAIMTFTPLKGYSEVVAAFTDNGLLIDGQHPDDKNKYVVRAGWDDIPHMTEETKAYLKTQFSAHEYLARSQGVPALGEGAVFPIPEVEYVIEPFKIPSDWPRAYGMDPGKKCTAVEWGAMDPNSDVVYIYSEHYQGDVLAAVHAQAIKSRGIWIKGTIDPSSQFSATADSKQTYMLYREQGLDLILAKNARESGILRINNALACGQLKIFRTCSNLLREMRSACRDEKGNIKNQHNYHATDALRYLMNDRLNIFRTYRQYQDSKQKGKSLSRSRLGADPVTGY